MLLAGGIFVLMSIAANGDTVVEKIDITGKVIFVPLAISCEKFYAEYSPDKSGFPENAAYPLHSPVGNRQCVLREATSKIEAAMQLVSKHYGDANVLCRISPRKCAFALQSFKKGELVLVPVTTRIKSFFFGTLAGDALPSMASLSSLDNLMECTGATLPEGYSFHLQPMMNDVVCPAWYMQDTDDAKNANMKVSMIEVEMNMKVGKPSRQSKESNCINLPVFVNSKPLQWGNVLVFHKPAKESVGGVKRPFDLI